MVKPMNTRGHWCKILQRLTFPCGIDSNYNSIRSYFRKVTTEVISENTYAQLISDNKSFGYRRSKNYKVIHLFHYNIFLIDYSLGFPDTFKCKYIYMYIIIITKVKLLLIITIKIVVIYVGV